MAVRNRVGEQRILRCSNRELSIRVTSDNVSMPADLVGQSFAAATVDCIHRIQALRRQGLPVFFTIDAGPQVKAVCLPEAALQVRTALLELPGVLDVTDSKLGQGAWVE